MNRFLFLIGAGLLALSLLFAYLWVREGRRAERIEKLSIEPTYRNALIGPDEIQRLKSRGLVDPVNDLRADLAAHPELIPFEGVAGGTMGFYDRERITLLPGGYVYAPCDDGHILGHMILRYAVKPGGSIEWKVIDAVAE